MELETKGESVMNRTYTYAELKDLINEELVNYNFIIESNHIFNSEFNKYRKFFKGLLKKTTKTKNGWYNPDRPDSELYSRKFNYHYPTFNTYENSNGFGLYFSLTKENVVGLDMNPLQYEMGLAALIAIDFPNLKADQEKLLSLKPNVRSGKRPKDLEKDYEAERLKKAAEEDKATCGICNQYWELVNIQDRKNIIHDHGFTIRPGFRSGVCFGARYECWEKSPESKKEYVRVILKPDLKKVVQEKPTLETVKEVNYLIVERSNKFKAYYKLSYEEQRKTDGPEKPGYILSGQQIGVDLPLDKEINLEFLTKVWSDWKTHLENEIARFETAIKDWKLQPTPRERLTEFQADNKIQVYAGKSPNNNPELKTKGENDE